MAEKGITNNFNAPITINGGTLNGDITGPHIYNLSGNTETFNVDDLFDGRRGGIGNENQFWILLVAAKARRIEVKNIPIFVNAAFEKWSIPLDKAKCISSTQELLNGRQWKVISNNVEMNEFITKLRAQPNQLASDLQLADKVFLALKDVTIP